MSLPEFEFTTEAVDDGVIARPVGMVHHTNATILDTELRVIQSEKPSRLVLDLAGVPEIDSAAVAVLVAAVQRALRDSSLLVLCNLQERVVALLNIVGLVDTVFTIVNDVGAVLALPNRRDSERFVPNRVKCSLGAIHDLSLSGARLEMNRPSKGDLTLRLEGEDGNVVDVAAEVVWSAKIGLRRHMCGVRFVSNDEDALNGIARIVAGATQGSVRAKPESNSS